MPYDAATTKATGSLVSGMRPATHRLQSFGHDPAMGFLVGVADLMHGGIDGGKEGRGIGAIRRDADVAGAAARRGVGVRLRVLGTCLIG